MITVVDTRKKKRLMVDGLHKAAALTMAYEKKINITEIKIIECRGERVDVLFPCDIHQLPV